MREIKFRAWVEDATTMTDIKGVKWNYEGPQWLLPVKPIAKHNTYKLYGMASLKIAASRANLMQYTGLKDMNGVEIYEGDILRYNHGGRHIWHYLIRCYTEYDYNVYGDTIYRNFAIDDETGGDVFGDYHMNEKSRQSVYTAHRHSEVIGNIYENPELIK